MCSPIDSAVGLNPNSSHSSLLERQELTFSEYEKALDEMYVLKHPSELSYNWFGNVSVSLYWEEKVLLSIRYLQLLSLIFVSIYEDWPYQMRQDFEKFIFVAGFNFVYLKGYYEIIEDINLYMRNTYIWIASFTVLIAVLALILSRQCCKLFIREVLLRLDDCLVTISCMEMGSVPP